MPACNISGTGILGDSFAWFEDHDKKLEFVDHMIYTGEWSKAKEVRDFYEKPWHWSDKYEEFRQTNDR